MTGRGVALVATVSVVATLSIAGCARTVPGAAQYADDTDTAATPLVKNDALIQLLPTSAEVSDLIGRPDLEIESAFDKVQALNNIVLSEPKCLSVIYPLLESEYRAKGYHATFGMLGDDPQTPFKPDLSVGVTTFDDAQAAVEFVAGQTTKWQNCTDRPLTERAASAAPDDWANTLTWVAAEPATVDGVRTVTRTLEGQRGYGCARAISARSNVVADVDVCATKASAAAERAEKLVAVILANVSK